MYSECVVIKKKKINEINKFKKCRNFQKPLTESKDDAFVEKGPSLRKGEIQPHFRGTHQAESAFFHSAASKVAHLIAKSRGFACGFCLLLVSRQAS